jgi:hypothetical protein
MKGRRKIPDTVDDLLVLAIYRLLDKPQYELVSHPDPPAGVWHGSAFDLLVALRLDGYDGPIADKESLLRTLVLHSNALYLEGVWANVDGQTVTLELDEEAE